MIEWAEVKHVDTEYVTEPGDLRDERGTGNDGPALGIFSGAGGGLIIEADTPAELVAWLRALADEIEEADEDDDEE